MKGEWYVINTAKKSYRALNTVMQYTDAKDPNSVIEELREPDTLGKLVSRLPHRPPPDRVFDVLAELIRERFQVVSTARFRRADLRSLTNPEQHLALAEIIGGSESDALSNLFDHVQVERTIGNAGVPLPSTGSDLRHLLKTAEQDAALIEAAFGYGTTDWGDILQEEGWIRPAAAQKLLSWANQQSLKSNDDASKALALLLERSREKKVSPVADTEGEVIGSLGLSFLRQRVERMVDRLRYQAAKYAEEAAQLAPEFTTIASLAPMIAIFERGAIRQALPDLIKQTYPISGGLDLNEIEFFDLAESRISPNKNLIFEGELTTVTSEAWRQVLDQLSDLQSSESIDSSVAFPEHVTTGTFEVKCHLRLARQPHPVMKCRHVPKDIYEKLEENIPKLKPRDLWPHGETLAQRLLNTPIPMLDTETWLLSNAVRRLGPVFAQVMILSGVVPDISLEPPWHEYLSKTVPYQSTPLRGEADFTMSVQDIASQLQKEYAKQRRTAHLKTNFDQSEFED